MFVEEDITFQREHPHLTLEDRTRLGKGTEGFDQAFLELIQKIENSWDTVHIHKVD